MEEAVDELALLQAQLNAAEIAIDNDAYIIKCRAAISSLEIQLGDARDVLHDLISRHGKDPIEERIDEIKAWIIDEWTGEHKTMVFDAGTLKFRQTGSLKIIDELYLFAELYDHVTIDEIVKKYLKGFNLTAVKKYMGVHDLPIDVAEIEYKTTVKLEQKSG